MFLHFPVRRLIAPLFLAVFSVSCVTGPKLQSVRTSIPDTQFRTQNNISHFGVPSPSLSGQYHGLLACQSGLVHFKMDLQATEKGILSGTITQWTAVSHRPLPKGQTPPPTVSSVNGSYDPVNSSIRLVLRTARNQPASSLHRRMANLQGQILPDASALVMYDTSPFGHNCSPWVARRGNSLPAEWGDVAQLAGTAGKLGIMDTIRLRRERTKDRERTGCDPVLTAWLDETARFPKMARPYMNYHLQRMLYSDAIFARHFGKSFTELEPVERMSYEIQLQGSCQREYQRRVRAREIGKSNWRLAMATFPRNSSISDVDKAVSALGFAISDAWYGLARTHLKYMSEHKGNPELARVFTRKQAFYLQRLLPDQRDKFSRFVIAELKKMIIPVLQRELDQELTVLPGTLENLEALANFGARSLKRFPEIELTDIQALVDLATDRINKAALASARNYGKKISGIEGVHNIDSWRERYATLAATLAINQAQGVDRVLAERRVALASEILTAEKRAFKKQVVASGNGIEAVKASVKYEVSFNQRLKPVLGAAGFSEFKKERLEVRNRLLASNYSALARIVHSWRHASILAEKESDYFLPIDQRLSSGKKIVALLENQRRKVAPFGEGNFNAYLNALYTYDHEQLRKIDRDSIYPVVRAMYAFQPIAGALEKLFFGEQGMRGTGRTQIDIEIAKLKESSLIYPLMAYYLMNYQNYRLHCSKINIERTVTTTWVETRNDIIVDTGESKRRYKFDIRFNHIFEVIYESDPDSVVQRMADKFFKSKGKIYRDELISGTHKFLQRSCKDQVTRKVEDNMIRYFNAVKKRIDAVS